MIRRTAALLIALVSLVALGACSSSDKAEKVEGTSTTTEASTTTTEDEDEKKTTTTDDEGLKAKIDLGGLPSSSSGEISSADEECVAEGVLDDPDLSAYDSFEELTEGPQSDLEAFYLIYIDCVGADVVIDQFMSGFSSSGDYDDDQLDCVRSTVEELSAQEGAALLAGDPDVTEALTQAVVPCIM